MSDKGGIVTRVAKLIVVVGGTSCELARSGRAFDSLARVAVADVGGVVTREVELVGGGSDTFRKIAMSGGPPSHGRG